MAVTTTTTKLIQFRPIYRPSTASPISIQFFSTSSSTSDPNEDTPQTNSNSPPPLPPKSPPSYASLFDDVKATLKQHQGNPQSQPSRSPFSFLSSFPTSNAPVSSFKIRNREEIEKNLSEFRRRSAVPPPSPDSSATQPPQHVSFEEIYRRNAASRGEESSSAGSKLSDPLKAIAESLRNIRTTTAKNPNERFGRNYDKMSVAKLKDTFKMKPGDESGRDSTTVIGGSGNLPPSIFEKEMREKDGDGANADTREVFVMYTHKDLGEKLKSLRPDKKGDWFSLQELNERLRTLRELDRKEGNSSRGIYAVLKSTLTVLQKGSEMPKERMQTVDLMRLGRTPSYMLSPPQEHLVEKYFHPDNMSASEKLKLELKKVRDEFRMSESDCGSARVQVAQLTTKIKHLSTVLHKKDKHSKKGLQGMVQKRKTLLKYLRRTDWESYCFVLSKLGLRDNPGYKT